MPFFKLDLFPFKKLSFLFALFTLLCFSLALPSLDLFQVTWVLEDPGDSFQAEGG